MYSETVSEGKKPDLLTEMKNCVQKWHKYFQTNIKRYHDCRNFIFRTNISDDQASSLGAIEKPAFEFNVLESYLSRMRGEFSKQEPSFNVHAAPDSEPVAPQLEQVIEGHLQAILNESKKESFEFDVYTDQTSGGFSAMKVCTEYENDSSFNQKIVFRRVYDPTMCGFDPLAKNSTKDDGEYCFEIYPLSDDQFHKYYPDENINQLGSQSLGDYKWSYRYGNNKIVLVCCFYKKKYKRKKIVYLANKKVMSKSEYNKMIKNWDDFTQPPVIKKERIVNECTICRYVFIEDRILEETDTIFKRLPISFVDGNSAYLRVNGDASDVVMYTRPYFYHALDSQRLKNIAGQTLANELEGMVTHKWKAPKEGIPEQYQEAYKNPQKASIIIYNAFKEDGITEIPPPQEIQHPPVPPEIANTFQVADQTIQNILGAFNTQLGVNDNDISGIAIVEAMTQSNASAMPYVVNFLAALTQCSRIALDIMPDIYFNSRTIPVINKERKKVYQGINGHGQNSINFDFDPDHININIEAGVNFEVQKNRSVTLMGALAQQFVSMQQLINTKGLPILLDNLNFRGSDQLKDLADQMLQEQQQAQAQQGQAPNPGQIEAMKMQVAQQELQLKQQELQMKAQQMQQQAQHQATQSAIGMQKLRADQQKDVLDFVANQQDNQVQLDKNATERAVHAHKIIGDHVDRVHSQTMDILKHNNEMKEKEYEE